MTIPTPLGMAMRIRRRTALVRALCLLPAALGLSFCTGVIGTEATSRNASGREPGTGPVMQDGEGTGAGGSTTQEPGDIAEIPDRPAMRRLTHAQYNNTVRDLLSIGGDPAAGFAEDEG